MELLGIGFVILCYYTGKGWYETSRTTNFLKACKELPEEERLDRIRDFLDVNELN